MPELPEVETVRRTLLPRVLGKRIERVVVRERRLRRPIAADFAAQLTGRTITAIRRLGKYLLFDLDGGATWIVHLGMTGCLSTQTAEETPHVHVAIALSDGIALRYDDPRRFGLMLFVPRALPAEIAALGVDPLGEAFTPEYLHEIARRRRPIKNLLMDQNFVAGIGNIYANEILFRAGVRPSRRSERLRWRDLRAICDATRTVLHEAIALGGSSISDYRDGEGRPGYFQLHLHVYDRAGAPCLTCGGTIRSRVMAGRSSFYCSTCQR